LGARGLPVVPEPVQLASLNAEDDPRRPTGLDELDRVLGGGAVPGSVVLLGGEPGIGKSTLLLEVAAAAKGDALYAAGEESPTQVARRARRLGLTDCGMRVIGCTDTAEIVACLEAHRPKLCVIDSVQTLQTPGASGSPGGPSQVRAAADELVPVARRTGTVLLLVGQVTKVGGLAGPRMLEHAVDVVLLFEGDRHTAFRVLRGVKNRYGPTDEIGLFEMREDGLHQVRNASQRLLAERGEPGPGALVGVAVEGRRALCLEVQALIVGDNRTSPRRRGQGVDPRRLELLVGVVESLFCAKVQQREVFVNVVGGLSTRDPGLDLAIAASVLSAQQGDAVPHDVVAIGEVGLRGEVRSVSHMTARLKEARAMGFTRAVVPTGTPPIDGMRLRQIRRIHQLFWKEGRGAAHSGSAKPGTGNPGAGNSGGGNSGGGNSGGGNSGCGNSGGGDSGGGGSVHTSSIGSAGHANGGSAHKPPAGGAMRPGSAATRESGDTTRSATLADPRARPPP